MLAQGKTQSKKITLHKHSIGVSPIFAFGSLLLLAAPQFQRGLTACTTTNSVTNSQSILQRLCQVARDYYIATQSLALSFRFGLNLQSLSPAALAEIKHLQAIPWPLSLDEPEEPSLLQLRITHRRRQQQRK